MRAASLLLCAAAISVCACTTLSSDQHARELADSRQDDGYCVDHGLRYPDAGYVQCRRQLENKRLYRSWQNLRMLQGASQPPHRPTQAPVFHAPDPTTFHCRAEPQFGNDYVFCGYDDPATGQKIEAN
jgi:hypothetical protein